MRVEVPIVDRAGNVIAELVWDGTLYTGKGQFVQVAATDAQIRALRGMVTLYGDLRRARFRSVGDRAYVSGWHGLEGTVGALRLVLPAVGLAVGQFDRTAPIAVETPTEEKKAEVHFE